MRNRLKLYAWEGMDKEGLRLKGTFAAQNESAALTELKRQEIFPIRIRKKLILENLFRKKIKMQDIIFFSRYLTSLLFAQIPLMLSLEMIAKNHHNTVFQELVTQIKNEIAAGKSFYDSLKKNPDYFSDLFINLVKVGEQSGTLDCMLNRITHYLEKVYFLKKRVKKAMYYPLTIIFTSSLVGLFIFTLIMPQFENLFSASHTPLPFFTYVILRLSCIFKKYRAGIFISLTLVVCIFIYLKKNSRRFNILIDAFLLKLPLFNKLIRNTIIARISRTLATMLAAGIPLLDCLLTVSTVTNNAPYSQAILKIREKVAIGQPLHVSLQMHPLFPNTIRQMISVGEESGTLIPMLNKIADLCEEEVDLTIHSLSTLLEPVLIIFLACIIGSFVLAVYLPIFKLGSIV